MYTEITTVEEALKRHPQYEVLKTIPELLSVLPKDIARTMYGPLLLEAVTFVLNNDDPNEEIFKPDYNDGNQEKWGQWTVGGSSDGSGSGFRLFGVVDGWTVTRAFGGARFALKDRARAEHRWKFFSELIKDVLLILTN